jgi:hypothetical protein
VIGEPPNAALSNQPPKLKPVLDGVGKTTLVDPSYVVGAFCNVPSFRT